MTDQPKWRDFTADDITWTLGVANMAAPDTFSDGAQLHQAAHASSPANAAAGGQIVFIEGNVPDAQLLAAAVAPGVQVVILDPDQNGVQQIATYLTGHDIQNLAAISIVADGADGEIQLGNTLLSANNVGAYQRQLAEIGAALQPGGDLLLYGCDVAQNSVGDAFLGDLAAATGVADIAAASHVVGAAAKGGSFNLDVDLGTAAAATGPFTAAAVAAYPDLLGIASNLVWYITESSTTSDTGVYTIDVNGSAPATNPTDIVSTPSYDFVSPDGLAIDPSAGVYFVANYLPTGPYGDTNQIIEGNTNGSGTPSVIYTSGNSGGDAIVGLAFDQQNGLLYFAVTDANIPSSNTTTGIYTISTLGTGTRTATELVNLSSGTQAPNDIAIDTTHNLLFYTNGVPGLTGVEEVGVANLSTGAIINPDLVSYSSSGNVEPFGIAVDPATDTLYWTTVNFSANSGNAIYGATYSTGSSVTLSNTQTLATTSQAQAPIGIALDVPAGGYYVDTSTGVSNDTTANEVLFGSSLTAPATLTDVYNVPDTDGGTETLPTEAIVVEAQPTVTASGTVTFVHGEAAVTLDSGAAVADADGYDLASATVSIASGLGSDDTLSFTNQNGITGSYSSDTLTLTGVASAADYQTALDSVTFSTTSTSTTPRTIDWTVSDGVVTSPTTTSTVDVHVAPVVTAGATATFDGGDGPAALDSGLTVSDASSGMLVGASVTIVSATSTDRLNFSTQNGISGSYDTSDGVLTLTGDASVADYQTALDSVTYSVSPSNSDPTDGGSDTSRTIDWTVNDGTLSSTTATSTLDTVHTAPTVTAVGTVTFTGGGSAVTLDSGLALSDVDSGGVLSSATATIVGAIPGDTLNFTNTRPSTEGNIQVSSDSGGVLTLTSAGSTATLAQWQTALESVTYSFSPSNGDPTDGGSDTSRTIDWVLNDGSTSNGISNTSTSTLDTVHTAPTVTIGADSTATFIGGGTAVTVDGTLTVSDVDSGGNLASATVSIGTGFISGDDALNFTNQNGITGSYNASTGVLSLSGTTSVANYQIALDSITFSTTSATSGSRTIDWTVNDGVSSSTQATSTVDVHIPPQVTAGATVNFGFNGTPVDLDSGLTVSDQSSTTLASATVSIGTGFISGDDTLNFTNQNGITGTYNASTGVLNLDGTANLAYYQTALESITFDSTSTIDGNRTIDWIVSDSVASSAEATSTVGIVPCYCPGTLIRTPRGQKKVEKLKIGDRVMTASGVARPIKWIGRRSYSGRFVMGRKDILPVCIKAGALEDDVPKRDLWISPNHAIYLDGVLIEAKDLVNGVSIVQVESAESIEYFHVELDTHDVLIAEGALAESYIDDDNRLLFHNAHEYRLLYPDALPGVVAQYCAPRLEDGYEVEAARRRIALRAGLLSSPDEPSIGTLRGFIDLISPHCIAGWAQNIDHPEAPVCLDVYVGDKLIGQVLANRYREDLKQAGLGSGRHSFEFAPPVGLGFAPVAVEVRRGLDGSALKLSAGAQVATAVRPHSRARTKVWRKRVA